MAPAPDTTSRPAPHESLTRIYPQYRSFCEGLNQLDQAFTAVALLPSSNSRPATCGPWEQTNICYILPHMNEDVIENIRSRMERCRRLASMITDKKAIDVLEQMAREAEADIARLQERTGDIQQGPVSEA